MARANRLSGIFITPLAIDTVQPWTSLAVSDTCSEQLVKDWKEVYARDLIDSPIVSVDAETSVEEACEVLLSEKSLCLVVKPETSDSDGSLTGLFDFSDVNAFLTLAATIHTFQPEYLRDHPNIDHIVTAARAGRVPVKLVSNLSEKNPLHALPHDSTLLSLLEVFAHGTHRVLVRSLPPATDYVGMVSDRGVLSWIYSYAKDTPVLQEFLSSTLDQLPMPSLNIYASVIACTPTSNVLDAMKLMSEQGVSSVAVLDEETGTLLSAVSVTDIGKIVVPSESNQILSTPLHQCISYIKAPEGSTDGADPYPVYSVSPTNALSYTIQKLLATNAHRLFVTCESSGTSSPLLSAGMTGNLSGIVSVVDILSLFAYLAKISNIDPTRMQRHRRASSSLSDRDLERSRSGSRTRLGSVNRGSARNSVSSISMEWTDWWTMT